MEGYLDKWTNIVNGFQPRYVVLCPKKNFVVYFMSKEPSEILKPRGTIFLKDASISVDDMDGKGFTIITSLNSQYRFQASDITLRNQWISRLEEVILLRKSMDELKTQNNDNCPNFKSVELCVDLLKDGQKNLTDTIQNCSDDKIRENCESDLSKFGEIIESLTNNIHHIKSLSIDDTDIVENAGEMSEDQISDDSFHDAIDHTVKEDEKIEVQDEDGIHYDEERPDIIQDLQINTSVIAHLVSQVKIGMDLSKITFPTFVLEPRSLLEMFGDFFAHADHFSNISKYETPKERFIEVVRHYLSSFHAGRKHTVAKKPYNPVLGEKFMCIYKAENDRSNYPLNKDGPIPWARTCDVSFTAEQVSHHPPISAFYAECPNTNVVCNAHIYTKSRFLGISAAVQNIGAGVVSLLSFNENYQFNFPDGFARSIFTIPWFEFGGECYIICKETGFRADIEFHCKPFFNNRKHKVTASLYEGTSKTPFMNIYGEWNGIMYVGSSKDEKKTIFIDTQTEKIHRKYVKCLKEQDSNESRLLWIDVTKSLLSNDVDAATSAKNKIENYQRELAKSRTEKWTPNFFSLKDDDTWIYNNHLEKRLKQQR